MLGASRKPTSEAEHLTLDKVRTEDEGGALDAFFYVGGFPVPAIVDLAAARAIDLVPIDGPKADKLRGDYKFLARDESPRQMPLGHWPSQRFQSEPSG